MISTQNKSMLEAFELCAKLTVGATVFCYVFGFVVAVAHYTDLGVPLHEMSSEIYLSSGLSFIYINLLPVTAAWIMLPVARKSRDPLWGIATAGLITLSIGAAVNRSYDVPLAGALYVFTIVFGMLWVWRYWQRVKDFSLANPPWLILALVILAIGVPGIYARTIYPLLERSFGGGRPRFLAMQTIANQSSGEKSPLFSMARCATHSAEWPLCRSLWSAHETAENVYVMVTDVPGPCAQWIVRVPRMSDAKTCVVRIHASMLPKVQVIPRDF